MRCYLKCQVFPSWENHYEWTRRLHEGQVLELGKKDMPFDHPTIIDEIQVLCKVDLVKRVVSVTKVGNRSSTDIFFQKIETGQTLEFGDGSCFSLSGIKDRVYVSFEKDDDDKETEEDKEQEHHEGEIFYNRCWYDSNSHSFEREQRRNGDYVEWLEEQL